MGQWTQTRVARVFGDDNDRCRLCDAEPGTLLHRLSCPATCPAEKWPKPPAATRAFLDGLSEDRRRLLQTRGLLAIKAEIPEVNPTGWCRWPRPLRQHHYDTVNWYIDGSCLDGARVETARLGFAIVGTSPGGALIAYAWGCPPAWVHGAPGAEAWALFTLLQALPVFPV